MCVSMHLFVIPEIWGMGYLSAMLLHQCEELHLAGCTNYFSS